MFQGLGSIRGALGWISPHGGACAGSLGTRASRPHGGGAPGNENAGGTPAFPGTGGRPLAAHPRGEASSRRIRRNGWLYVDKTRFLRPLEDERYAFFIHPRPRRFGKSFRSAAVLMDDDIVCSCSSVDQKNNLPGIPILSIDSADQISRMRLGHVITRREAEHVSDPNRIFPQIFTPVLEKRAGHFSPCGCSRVCIVSSGSPEPFDIQRMLSPCPTNPCHTHIVERSGPRPVRLPGPRSHQDTRNRQREQPDQCDSRNSQFSRLFHRLPDPSGNVAAPRCTDRSGRPRTSTLRRTSRQRPPRLRPRRTRW